MLFKAEYEYITSNSVVNIKPANNKTLKNALFIFVLKQKIATNILQIKKDKRFKLGSPAIFKLNCIKNEVTKQTNKKEVATYK